MSNIEATQVLGSPLLAGATQMGGDPYRTQLGGTTTCPICKSTTSLMDPFCGDCGFMLASQPAVEADAPIELPAEEVSPATLIDEAAGRSYKLRAGVNTIGRQGTDILSSEGTVSRNHAKITVSETGVLVEDLGSSNGSRVGDRKLAAGESAPAVSGDQLRFGNWKLKLEVSAAATAPAEQTIMAAEATIMEAAPIAAAADPVSTDSVEPAVEPAAIPVAALLVKLEGPGEDLPIPATTITFGRKVGCDVVIADPYLSGKHGVFTVADGAVTITDTGSTNGTSVNGTKLLANVAQSLVDGDEVQLGQTRYRFETAATEGRPEIAPLVEGDEG
jgi:pSer/pThr/pTyr-binding forkhead associated (FHA) protein